MLFRVVMPFGVVSVVGRGMGVLDEARYRSRGKGNFGMNLGRPIWVFLFQVHAKI